MKDIRSMAWFRRNDSQQQSESSIHFSAANSPNSDQNQPSHSQWIVMLQNQLPCRERNPTIYTDIINGYGFFFHVARWNEMKFVYGIDSITIRLYG